MLTGVYCRDGGDILLDGEPINPHTPQESQLLGISTVYQEVNLVPFLSVAENICLGRQRTRFGCIRWRDIRQRANKAMARLGIEIDVAELLSSYSIAIQQLVAIARALDISAKLLILDEPTSSLDAGEVETLFRVMRQLKAEGLGIIFVTHFLDQVYAIADRITVLRNGKLVGAYETASLPRLELISRMMQSCNGKTSTMFLQSRKLGRRGALAPVDLEIGSGEVVGLAGLLGSGRTETARLLFGIDQADSGEMRIAGRPVAIRSPRDALAHHFGFCPEDRKTEGLIANLSVRENIVLALQSRQGWMRYLNRARQLELADQFIRALNIVTPNAEQPIRLLSGGNQQKVILARWLASHPRLLLLDEPTRGIDVGAKLEIEKLMAKLATEGMAILFISSDLEETVRNSHRVVVLRDRRKVAELSGDEVSEGNIMRAIAATTAAADRGGQ